MNVVLEILFLFISNIEINFANWYFYWKIYIGAKALIIIKLVGLIKKKEFATAIFQLRDKAFVVQVTYNS